MKKTSLIISFLITAFIISGYFYFRYVVTEFKIKELYIRNTDRTIYFKSFSRGLNYNKLAISCSKGRKTSHEKDYVYTWGETLFYRVSNDTLYVLCKNKAEEPTKFKSGVKVYQVEYSNPEYYELLKDFTKMGLEKFSQ